MKKNSKPVSRILTMGDDEIVNLFETAFLEQVGEANGISEIDVEISRDQAARKVNAEIRIYSMDDSADMQRFKQGKAPNSGKVDVEIEGGPTLHFFLNKAKTVYMTGNDYSVTYTADFD